jgi:phage-related protein
VKRLPAAFYALPSGREPVRDWLKSLDRDDRKIVGEDIKDVEFSWPPTNFGRHATLPFPWRRPLGGDLWEVRCDLTQGRIARVLFCVRRSRMVLLHAFVKKTRKTPAGEHGLAARRMKEIA